jgi:purine-binding chemotaxis protein CheW
MNQIDVLNQEIGIAADGNQFLTFTLGSEEYGVEILKVQEIKGYSAITPIPNTPAHIKGVMNLRGTVVPIVDLRKKFSLKEVEYDKFAVIVVVQVRGRVMGLIVDAVSDVLNISEEEIQATPDFGAQVDTRFISGMTRANERLIVLLDIEKVLGGEELHALGSVN